ncbi:MAG: SDR family NAD(P)-dependent oxidoreductase [Candidatus Micrarchaeota archaeon]|nr:SDR family NAD(P)-dependent oxidoreductase [Candidatus Micrarchaeota archaeon]
MILITGGAGFIGSNLTNFFISKGSDVTVFDNLSSGRMENLNASIGRKNFKFIKGDIRDSETVDSAMKGVEEVYHLAADPSVKDSATNPGVSFSINVSGTFSVLEAARKNDVKKVVFTSTSTVYGEAEVLPTPENYPLIPISNYAASKVADEAYISSYASTYGIKGVVLRLANIFGSPSTHGVMFDFYKKLKTNPKKLEILGNGKQCKSYLYISDCVDALFLASRKQKNIFDFFNVGSGQMENVNYIANTMCSFLKVKPKFEYTGGTRGWKGDVVKMLLDTKKIEKLGWRKKVSLKDGIRKYVEWLEATQ